MTPLRLYDGYTHTDGNRKGEVTELQIALNEHGESLRTDGLFGKTTLEAVMNFQRRHGLLDDGIVGPDTWGALRGMIMVGPPVTFATTYHRNSAWLLKTLRASISYMEYIREGAIRASVPVAVVWAIGCRESRWGEALTPSGPAGTGDYGHGRGLMQIDDRWHKAFTESEKWKDPAENIAYGCDVLRDNVRMFRTGYPTDTGLRMAIAAYNCGPGNVRRAIRLGRDIDYFTAHRDYSADVLSRAGWFELQQLEAE